MLYKNIFSLALSNVSSESIVMTVLVHISLRCVCRHQYLFRVCPNKDCVGMFYFKLGDEALAHAQRWTYI